MAIQVGDTAPSARRAVARLSSVQLDGNLQERDVIVHGQDGHGVGARIAHLSPGPVNLTDLTGDGECWVGLLIVQGVLIVEAQAGRARVGWAIGQEDLIRPWDLTESSITSEATWRVLTPAKVALLDAAFASKLLSTPALSCALVERTARTTRWLLAKCLVLSSPVIEERLLLLFALLAEKWGRVTSFGVRIDLPITHELLAILCGARRPSVTLALRSLTRQKLIERGSDGRWILERKVHDDGAGLPSCWPQYAGALGLG